jgi:hypothetical protein
MRAHLPISTWSVPPSKSHPRSPGAFHAFGELAQRRPTTSRRQRARRASCRGSREEGVLPCGLPRGSAVREPHCGSSPVLDESRCDCIRMLERQLVMIEEHLDHQGDPLGRQPVHRRQNPRGLREHEMRDPSALLDECFGTTHLSRVIARDETHDTVGVNGARVALRRDGALPPRSASASVARAVPRETAPGARPRTNIAPTAGPRRSPPFVPPQHRAR